MHILLIDDDPVEIARIRECVFRSGITLDAATTILSARALVEKVRPDVVLLDLYLSNPGPHLGVLLNGALEDWLAFKLPIPVVVLIDQKDKLAGKTAIHAGAQGYLTRGACDKSAAIDILNSAIQQMQAYQRVTAALQQLRDERKDTQ